VAIYRYDRPQPGGRCGNVLQQPVWGAEQSSLPCHLPLYRRPSDSVRGHLYWPM